MPQLVHLLPMRYGWPGQSGGQLKMPVSRGICFVMKLTYHVIN